MNNSGKTPQTIFTDGYKEIKAEGEKSIKDTTNSCTIAAALIVTVVFVAAIMILSGNASNGFRFLSTKAAFIISAVSDVISFHVHTSLNMFFSILTSRYAEEDFFLRVAKRLCIELATFFMSILFMMVAFSATIFIVFSQEKVWIRIHVAALARDLFRDAAIPVACGFYSNTYSHGIFDKQSNRFFY
ncbi:Ankyrin repeat family protein [Striga hermonthica]|uniref:Ankyrin repeat family protein n=1 Tax=Striga hermonthica TaxID=68872 RepID=A0A9N7MTC7_STRHE|nr:Ankyrin repeat family protein [Striga hermonthica]